jgi:MOSC domain-containing protein YiiM
MNIEKLLIKTDKGKPLCSVEKLTVNTMGIVGGIPTLPTRQVLLLPKETIDKFMLTPGDLRENIITSGIDIHAFTSGTVLLVGSVKIRLTYHCEPCKVISQYVRISDIVHQRGFLGTFLNSGVITTGDKISVSDECMEIIPYDIKKRIMWYLDKQKSAISIKDLAYNIGLSPTYYRAIPNMMRNLPEKYRTLVFSSTGSKNTPMPTLF